MREYVVDAAALAHNITALRAHAGDAVIWGVVKGNGYGLGCVKMAEILKCHGINHFAITDVAEARALREAGFRDEAILMLENTAYQPEVEELLTHRVIFSVGSAADAQALNEAAQKRGMTAQAHWKIDTGMGRFGFLPEQRGELLELYDQCPAIAFTGIYTHFFDAGSEAAVQTQFDRLLLVVKAIREAGREPGMLHCCNSIAFWRYPELHCDAVRIGSALLGRVSYAAEAGLKRVGLCRTRVEQVRTIPAGHTVGYDAGWRAKQETKIAVIPVGYFHGFGVERGNDLWRGRDCLRGMYRYAKAWLKKKALYVTTGGRPCRVLGHVGMVNLVADVTGLAVQPNDEALVEINPLLVKGMEIKFE